MNFRPSSLPWSQQGTKVSSEQYSCRHQTRHGVAVECNNQIIKLLEQKHVVLMHTKLTYFYAIMGFLFSFLGTVALVRQVVVCRSHFGHRVHCKALKHEAQASVKQESWVGSHIQRHPGRLHSSGLYYVYNYEKTQKYTLDCLICLCCTQQRLLAAG